MTGEQLVVEGVSDVTKDIKKYVTIRIADQVFGMCVDVIEDILFPQYITAIPLSSSEVVGSLNLRGRIVTTIDLRTKFSIGARENENEYRIIVVEHNKELYSFVVDSVADVLDIARSQISQTPENISPVWAEVSKGVYLDDDNLMIILDARRLLKDIDEEDNEDEE